MCNPTRYSLQMNLLRSYPISPVYHLTSPTISTSSKQIRDFISHIYVTNI